MGTTTLADVTVADVTDAIYTMWGLVDRGRASETVPMCAPDFVMSAVGMTIDRDQFAQMMAAREHASYVTRHLINNVRIVDRTTDGVTVTYVACVHRLDDGSELPSSIVADGVDTWTVVDGALSLRRRAIDLVLDGRPVGARGV